MNYDEKNWMLLTKALHSIDRSNIDVLNRAQILDDSLNLAYAGILDYNIALDLVAYLRNEEDYLPWTAAYHELEYIYTLLGYNENFQVILNTL